MTFWKKWLPAMIASSAVNLCAGGFIDTRVGQVLASSSDTSEEMVSAARLLVSQGRFAEAEKGFLAALQQVESSMKVSSKSNDDNSFAFDFKQVTEIEARIYNGLIDCYLGEKKWDMAESTEEKLLKLRDTTGASDYDMAMEYNNAAAICFGAGHYQKCREMLEKAFALGPQFYKPAYAELQTNYRKVLRQLNATRAQEEFDKKLADANPQPAFSDNTVSEVRDDGNVDDRAPGSNSLHEADTSAGASEKSPVSQDTDAGSARGKQRIKRRKTISAAIERDKAVPAVTAGGGAGVMDEEPLPDKDKMLNLAQARQYLLSLINRDRAKFHLPPVVLDKHATAAAQFHSDDTASRGYNDHYDPEGRSPDWRYTLVGGTHTIGENNLGPWYSPDWKYSKAAEQSFSRKQLEKVESLFFDEKPPKDGHRKNILRPAHNRVGLGLSVCNMARPGVPDYPYVTCCQEFADAYGSFKPLPLTAQRGTTLALEGKLDPSVALYCISVERENIPQPATMESLRQNTYHSYGLPGENITTYWPRDVEVLENNAFRAEIKVPQGWKDGLYHFVVWVKPEQSADPVVTSRMIVAVGQTATVRPIEIGEAK